MARYKTDGYGRSPEVLQEPRNTGQRCEKCKHCVYSDDTRSMLCDKGRTFNPRNCEDYHDASIQRDYLANANYNLRRG